MIAEAVEDMTFDDYLVDAWLRAGVERQLEIIGEAPNSVRRTLAGAETHIPRIHEWIALRHLIAHTYDAIDHRIIWDTCCRDLPELQEQLNAILNDPDAPSANIHRHSSRSTAYIAASSKTPSFCTYPRSVPS